MSFYIAMGQCIICRRTMAFNPDLVPSLRVNREGKPDPDGIREPVCEACVTRANAEAIKAGKPTFQVPTGAYEPASDNPLDDNDF